MPSMEKAIRKPKVADFAEPDSSEEDSDEEMGGDPDRDSDE
jgi:hypothetical protein